MAKKNKLKCHGVWAHGGSVVFVLVVLNTVGCGRCTFTQQLTQFVESTLNIWNTSQLRLETFFFALERQTLFRIQKFERPTAIAIELKQMSVVDPETDDSQFEQRSERCTHQREGRCVMVSKEMPSFLARS